MALMFALGGGGLLARNAIEIGGIAGCEKQTAVVGWSAGRLPGSAGEGRRHFDFIQVVMVQQERRQLKANDVTFVGILATSIHLARNAAGRPARLSEQPLERPPKTDQHHRPRAAGQASRLAIILRRRPKPASALAYSQISIVSITP